MKIYVDVDDTICKTVNGNYNESVPHYDRIEKINKLFDKDNTIVYWTARGSNSGINWFDLTLNQLNKWGCKFHELRLGKPSYDLYIDDKSINSDEYFK